MPIGTRLVQLKGLKGHFVLHRSPLFRLLGCVLALVVAANAALAGRPHGCDASRAASLARAGGSPAHVGHGAGHQSDRTIPEECSCVGHACCSATAQAIVTAPTGLPAVSVVAVIPDLPAAAGRTPLPPPHLHPFPLGPPAHLS